MSIKMMLQVFNDRGFEMKISVDVSVLNTLRCEGYFAQHSEFFASKRDLLATNIRHLDPKLQD